ncbi:MAG: hypothetical protein C4534_08180 [Gaiellales bacterium]|nr:MAG: hypothetical protein C4534_08180 [Gaiellales bacterium]
MQSRKEVYPGGDCLYRLSDGAGDRSIIWSIMTAIGGPAMKTYTRQQIAAEIKDLMRILDLANAGQVAALLRNPEESYPSPGLIRTYLGELADPAEKFVRLLRTRRGEVDAQLVAGVQAVTVGENLHAIFKVEPKRHIITILSQEELDKADYRRAHDGELTTTVLASLAVPSHWLHTCAVCGRPFVARSTRSQCCYRLDERGKYACRLELRRRERRLKRK